MRSTIKSLSRTTRALLLFGLSLPTLGWIYWMNCAGPMWWYAYGKVGPDGQSMGAADERVLKLMWLAGIFVCIEAPWFSKGSFERRLLLTATSGVLAIGLYHFVGFIVMVVIFGY